MEPESSLPYSQVPATCPYPEPTPSSLHPLPLLKIHLNIILPSTSGVSPMVSFPQVSPLEPCTHLSPPTYAPHAPPISFFSILPPAQYLVRSKKSLSSSLCNFLHSLVTSSLLGPNSPQQPIL